ncbi:MAG: hypothetical protein ABIQ73_26615 [Acidimicrobiales bacterium]
MGNKMNFRGRTVEVFGRTPTGALIPVLPADVDGEADGDVAYIDGKAMKWDGARWVACPWSEFALWVPVGPPC